jgi:hypothetical protein
MSLSVVLLPRPGSAAEVNCADHSDQRLAEMTDTGISSTSGIGLAAGRYALPDTAPTVLVVMFHGHGNDSCSWRRHLQQAVSHGAAAVAMDYTGQRQTPAENYGWFVREGAADSIEAANYFLRTYHSITKVVAFGISMGGNAAGMAVASDDAVRTDPTRTDYGAPLFDYLIDVEGVNNLTEEYLIARGVAPVNGTAALAQQEIEEENGGKKLEEDPAAYVDLTNVARAGDMDELQGAIVINGLDDGLVPTNQSPEMTAALTAAGVPVHQFTVLLRGDDDAGTTGTGILPGVFKIPYESSLAGHGWEGSDTHLVIKTGFDQLWALLAGGTVAAGETIVPGQTS